MSSSGSRLSKDAWLSEEPALVRIRKGWSNLLVSFLDEVRVRLSRMRVVLRMDSARQTAQNEMLEE